MDQETRDVINEVKRDGEKAVDAVKTDTKETLGEIKEAMTGHFDKQSERAATMYRKQDEQTQVMNEHIQVSLRKEAQIDLELEKNKNETEKNTKLITDHLGVHKWKLRWILGIFGSVVATIVAAAILAFR